jgi:hypothetical protein
MTDKELLEAAAKAVNGGAWHPLTHNTPNGAWNPLADDGDALRLAVKLGIHISQQLSYCATFCPHGDNNTRGTTWTEQYSADPAAATRRAIVRAAAAMVDGRAVCAA